MFRIEFQDIGGWYAVMLGEKLAFSCRTRMTAVNWTLQQVRN